MNIKTQRSGKLTNKCCLLSIALFWLIMLSGTINAKDTGQNTMDENSVCQHTPLKNSQEMIRFILNDLTETYTQVGGGGISGIKQVATYSYRVSISQEERVDQITYELEVDQHCKITIVNRTVSTKSARER